MARILLTTWGSYGDLFPFLGLARELMARGHDPVLATAPFYRARVEAEGIGFAPVRPDVDPEDRETVARIMHPARGTEYILRTLIVPVLRESYADVDAAAEGADLVVSHPVTFAARMVAERRGLPWLSTVLAPMSFFSVHDLPVFPPAPWLVHARRLGTWAPRALVGMARAATRRWMGPVHDLRRELGLPGAGDPLFEGQFSPLGTLALFSRVMGAPQPDWPRGVEVTGFVFYNGPGGLSPELEAFLDAGEPPVVFTLGSSAVGVAGRFYHESAEAVARIGRRAVLLAGPHAENRPPEPLPPDVFVADFAPHQLLFPRAAAVVHQGGAGTTGQALRSGRPELVVPHAHDQPDNAFRVTELGVARTLYPGRYRAARVARELRALLEEPAYAARAAEVGETVRGEGGAAAAADGIERALG